MIKVLLLTYKSSDNLGDQIIEACIHSLLKLVFEDLGVADFYIDSQDIEAFLPESAAEYQMIVFGGGGIIKFEYEEFHKYVPAVVAVADENEVPVLFSSVGVEGFNANSARCQRLKESLNKPCVKQITTRDDFESLKLYIDNPDIAIAPAADSALYSGSVFGIQQSPTAKTIGLAVVRKGIFKRNGIDWEFEDEMVFWSEVIDLLKSKGYRYQVFTMGHFDDEVFALEMVKRGIIDRSEMVAPICSSEQLFDTLSHMAGVIAFRLHAGIVSYALGVPAINLSWNNKVTHFYQNINLPERVLEFEDWNAQSAVSRLEQALKDRKEQKINTSYLYSTYSTLFDGVVACLEAKKLLPKDTPAKKRGFEEILASKALYLPPRSDGELLALAHDKIMTIERRYAKVELQRRGPTVLNRIVKGLKKWRWGRFLVGQLKKIKRAFIH
ncbi:MAG: polysaccharide pyruvyl transferase family protein [Coriobacteriia bacterium]|nr:polysaccharide pyruvyl transferase family protein [Coriobacteriia bacterium]